MSDSLPSSGKEQTRLCPRAESHLRKNRQPPTSCIQAKIDSQLTLCIRRIFTRAYTVGRLYIKNLALCLILPCVEYSCKYRTGHPLVVFSVHSACRTLILRAEKKLRRAYAPGQSLVWGKLYSHPISCIRRISARAYAVGRLHIKNLAL